MMDTGTVTKLAEAFHEVADRRFVGTVEAYDALEWVFEQDEDDHGRNLVSLYLETGKVRVGYVSKTHLDDGYGQPT